MQEKGSEAEALKKKKKKKQLYDNSPYVKKIYIYFKKQHHSSFTKDFECNFNLFFYFM